MRTASTCIVVSGLPASGKTTLAKQIADRLGLPYLDKDDFLERLFERSTGVGDHVWRRRLSKQSNVDFERAAIQFERIVLVSHWRPNKDAGPAGTPTPWIPANFNQVVELYCRCPIPLAVSRFMGRTRHAGHHDKQRTFEELTTWFSTYAQQLPLGLGPVIEVDSASVLDDAALVKKVQKELRANCL